MVEGDSLENCYIRNGIVSSNLTPTANFQNSDFGRLLPRPAFKDKELYLRYNDLYQKYSDENVRLKDEINSQKIEFNNLKNQLELLKAKNSYLK